MKIFQVVPYYPPHVGGMEFYVQRLSEELAARGHEVTVFASSNNNFASVSKVNGVRVISLRQMTKIYNVPIAPSLFWRLIHEEKPDVIHAHQYPVFFSDMTAAVSALQNTPFLVHVHVVSEAKSTLSGFISNMYYSTLGRCTLQTADTVIAPSLAYKSKLIKMHVDQEKIQVVPYGIDTEKFHNNTKAEEFKAKYGCRGSKVILSVGRLNYQKGFQYLIKAMPAVLKQISNVKLVIVGEGEQQTCLVELAKSLGVSGSVVFTGALGQAEIPNAYAACDVFVLPSLFESFGISLIEAQASGKPVVATRTGGAPEALVDGATGLLVEPAVPKQLEAAVIRILSDDNLAGMMGENGRKFVEEHFGIQAVVNSILGLYEKLVYDNLNAQ